MMRNSGSLRSPRLLLALALLIGLAAAVGGLRWATSSPPPVAPVAGDPDAVGAERYMVTRGENEAEESSNLERIEAIWNSRITYPTGRFDAAWLQEAAAQDRQMAE